MAAEYADGARWRVGTSGWSYKHWRERFYPRGLSQRKWLEHYAAHFDTVELNASFYRLPTEHAFTLWREGTPPGFLFAVKASRTITHYQRLAGSEASLALFLERAALLGDKLGPILFQLPPSLARDDALLAAFLDTLPAGRRYAVEFRHASWYEQAVYDLLAARDVAFCWHDFAGVASPVVVTASFVYARFHGRAGRYVGEYGVDGLREWRRQTRSFAGREVFAYFNNDAEAQAVRDALALRALLTQEAAG